jgi:hypothetical protein
MNPLICILALTVDPPGYRPAPNPQATQMSLLEG